uniref:Uncharacterized protein n=1 Tax=Ditylenchus dipsaci TaxID=166011 RepID=A0A915D9H5_9BILA
MFLDGRNARMLNGSVDWEAVRLAILSFRMQMLELSRKRTWKISRKQSSKINRKKSLYRNTDQKLQAGRQRKGKGNGETSSNLQQRYNRSSASIASTAGKSASRKVVQKIRRKKNGAMATGNEDFVVPDQYKYYQCANPDFALQCRMITAMAFVKEEDLLQCSMNYGSCLMIEEMKCVAAEKSSFHQLLLIRSGMFMNERLLEITERTTMQKPQITGFNVSSTAARTRRSLSPVAAGKESKGKTPEVPSS